MHRKLRRRIGALCREELEVRTLLSTLIALVDTGIDLNDSASYPYYDLINVKNMIASAIAFLRAAALYPLWHDTPQIRATQSVSGEGCGPETPLASPCHLRLPA